MRNPDDQCLHEVLTVRSQKEWDLPNIPVEVKRAPDGGKEFESRTF
jgi:hypothetical protein